MFSKIERRAASRFLFGAALGALVWWVSLKGGFAILRNVWPAYAVADPERGYTLLMLFIRLAIFIVVIFATSAVAAWVSRDSRVAPLTGAVILAVSIPLHLYPGYLWDDYPAWYHIVYLFSILPTSFLASLYVEQHLKRRSSTLEDAA